MKKKMIVGIAAVFIMMTGFICFGIWFLFGADSTYYYAQIDNSKMEQSESKGGVISFSGSMDYSYTLFCCDEDGKGKDITFGTSRELKEGAFIRLPVMPVRGVSSGGIQKAFYSKQVARMIQTDYNIPYFQDRRRYL